MSMENFSVVGLGLDAYGEGYLDVRINGRDVRVPFDSPTVGEALLSAWGQTAAAASDELPADVRAYLSERLKEATEFGNHSREDQESGKTQCWCGKGWLLGEPCEACRLRKMLGIELRK